MSYLVGRVFAQTRLLGYFACNPNLTLATPRIFPNRNELELFVGERELVGYKQVGCTCGADGEVQSVRLWVQSEGQDGAYWEGVICAKCQAIKGCRHESRRPLVLGYPGDTDHPGINRVKNRLEGAAGCVREARAYWKQVAARIGELSATDQERLALVQELNAVGIQVAQLLQTIYEQASELLSKPDRKN